MVGGAALAQLGDVPELLVAVQMRDAGELLVVDAQRIAHRLEQSGDRLRGRRRCRARGVAR